MNLIKALRPRYRVHLHLLALEISGSPELEGFDEGGNESLGALITQLGDKMGYKGNWRDWDEDRQRLVASAVMGGLNDFDFRADDDTEELCDG